MIQNDQRYNKIMFLRKILSKPSLLAAQYILRNHWDWSFDVSKQCSDILGPNKMFNNYYPGWWRNIESEPPLLPPASSWGSRDSSQVHQRLQNGHQVWLLTIFSLCMSMDPHWEGSCFHHTVRLFYNDQRHDVRCCLVQGHWLQIVKKDGMK